MSAASAAADEERRKAEKPLCTPDEARELAAAAFGITDIVAVKELESYDDRNFRIKGRLGVGAAAAEATSEETYFTLKVHNGVESDSPSSLDAQDAAMLYLHEKGLRVPGVDGHRVEKQLVVRPRVTALLLSLLFSTAAALPALSVCLGGGACPGGGANAELVRLLHT